MYCSTNNFAQERQRSGLTVKTLSVKFLWNNKTVLFIAFLQIVSISNRTTLNTCNSGMKMCTTWSHRYFMTCSTWCHPLSWWINSNAAYNSSVAFVHLKGTRVECFKTITSKLWRQVSGKSVRKCICDSLLLIEADKSITTFHLLCPQWGAKV